MKMTNPHQIRIAYNDGAKAVQTGCAESECPYWRPEHKLLYAAWRMGWRATMDQCNQRNRQCSR